MKIWNSSNTSAGQALIIEEDSGRSVAVAYDQADGPLLAAAPEMLEALETLVAGVGTLPAGSGFLAPYVKARAAIQKARGKQ